MGRWVAVVIGLAALLVGAGSALAAEHLVRITSTLSPATITVAPGDSITWRNDDGARHRVRSTNGPEAFDSGDLDPGETFTITLTAVGTYAYHDDRNRELSAYWGTVVVAITSPTTGATAAPGATPGPGATAGPIATPTGGTLVHMAGRAFSPRSITVPAGTSVRWLNDDDRDHTVTSSSGGFDSGVVRPGGSFTRTFSTPGAFPFLCAIHPDMTGTVNVLDAGGATPPPPPPATPATPTKPPAGGDVAIIDFSFTPADLTVDAGARVTFANRGAAIHTVTATDGFFDSGVIQPGDTFSRVYAQPGTYPFLCAVHPSMTGTIRVRGANGASPPPASSVGSGASTAAASPGVDGPSALPDGGTAQAGGAGGGSGNSDQLADDVSSRPTAAPAGGGFVLAVLLGLLLCVVAIGSYGLIVGDVIRRAER